jgi:hypothetical protein
VMSELFLSAGASCISFVAFISAVGILRIM